MNLQLLLLLISYLNSNVHGFDYVVKRVAEGDIRGYKKTIEGSAVEVDCFLGVPYGKPPVNELRFRAPLPAQTWSSVLDTVDYKAQCQQSDMTDFEKNNKAAGMWYSNITKKSEDCLYLNVWAPSSPKGDEPLAVMVWIYGGGYFSGTTALEVYIGDVLASRENVVVVSMEYRLGAYGFLYLGTEEAPGNQGLMDQELALMWIKKNIGVFGGDPKSVTVFGESAGGTSALFQAIKPAAETLFQRLIIQSGSFYSYWSHSSISEADYNANQLFGLLNCPIGNMTCIRSKSTADLNAKYWEISRYTERRKKIQLYEANYAAANKNINVFFDVGFKPVCEGKFIPLAFCENPEVYTLDAVRAKDLSVMVGINKNEASYFLLYGISKNWDGIGYHSNGNVTYAPLLDKSNKELDADDYVVTGLLPERYIASRIGEKVIAWYSVLGKENPHYTPAKCFSAYDRIASDIGFKCPISNLADKLASLLPPGKVFFYEFEHLTKDLIKSFPIWMGVMHGYEVEYIFGSPFNSAFSKYYSHTKEEKALSVKMMKMWAAFSKTGNPSIPTNNWPPYTISSKSSLVLKAARIETRHDSLKLTCSFWDQLRLRITGSSSITLVNQNYILLNIFIVTVFCRNFYL